ncbi:hypothetical protein BXZ70DRAFT_906693 [Cristinia sonorae]|uniref:Uncharacterized protein n=1 Tax=Cristinia sonorae TaxID=1940300 RepID=A0A8K0UQ37_9AGAR|nr:hypothetical protein BXZ70DRAFT_906693 [Cristinia sonorae]
MAAHPPSTGPRQQQQQLPRLFIPQGMNAQQPIAFNDNPALFSPALPTSIQHGMHPPFPIPHHNQHHQHNQPNQFHHPMQTPMQQNFFPQQPPNAPGRPTTIHHQHRAHPSVVQLAAAGILPPPGMLNGMPMTPGLGGVPMTPLGQAGFAVAGHQMMPMPMPFQTSSSSFVPKSRRTQSVSTGGPPKAVLGGPQRKVSPMPTAVSAAAGAAVEPVATPAAAVPAKAKKVVVKLPKETVVEKKTKDDGEEGEEVKTRPEWARVPLALDEAKDSAEVKYPELTSSEAFPPDAWRYRLPPTVDVFLPGKASWDSMKQRIIEEKLEKLGIEKAHSSGMSSTIPHIHAPHARAASISSPADPALLFFKLNKLQQSQNTSAANSISSSPQPPALSISPATGGPRTQPRHGHSMSLAQPPSFQTSSSPVYNPMAAFNPFGPSAVLGSDQIFPPQARRISPDPSSSAAVGDIAAPQGQVPMNVGTLAPPQSVSRPESRPDFMRGFGVEIPEEEEPEEEEEEAAQRRENDDDDEEEEEDVVEGDSRGEEDETDVDGDGDQDEASTVAQTRIHSRHVSRLSAALSLVSVGRTDDPVTLGEPPNEALENQIEVRLEVPASGDVDGTDVDAVEEWTGSEDLRTGVETSDDESIGEWSNPSDEERARKDRLHRRTVRRAAQLKRELEIPRRLPNFPRPPEHGAAYLTADDDIISNPSEEERIRGGRDSYLDLDHTHALYSRPASDLVGEGGRPLPPLPHSRAGSAQYSHHDPALAHSRDASEQYSQLGGLRPPPVNVNAPAFVPAATSTNTLRKNSLSLNPFAKPFVFGSAAPSFTSQTPPSASASATSFLHSRAPSFGKPLNAAAQEFKPGGFTFKLPSGVPQLTFAPPEEGPQTARPLPVPPKLPSPVRATQGREKRQRRGSNASASFADTSGDEEEEDGDREGQDTMHSFKFPPPASDSAKFNRHSAPASPPDSAGLLVPDGGLNVGAKPFTFSGFSASASATFGKQQDENEVHYAVSDSALDQDNTNKEDLFAQGGSPSSSKVQLTGATDLPFPPTASKPKRAPIPLDFKHPVSTNTVPAGLFKNLNNGDSEERTRRTVRSRLSSRDIFEHSPRQSLDDLNVPPISQRISRNRLFTDPGFRDQNDSPEPIDVFSSARRRTSMPARHSAGSSVSEDEDDDDVSIAPMNLSRRVEMQQYEQRLERLLDEKMDAIRDALDEIKQSPPGTSGQGISSSTEEMISEVVSLFRTQLQESATRSLEDSQADARGELDFEVIKDLIERGHVETRSLLQRDLANWDNTDNIRSLIQELSDRTLNHFAAATSQLTHHIRSIENSSHVASSEREAIVLDVIAGLTPHLAAMRSEPIDYEGLTMQLTQAVKPHISQLIDLASDKRETASLIVDRLLPLLPDLQSPAASPNIDMDDVVGRLVTEVRRIIAPLDAHEIKEQVSDLVVERLDSRLAVRDKAFNVDVVTEKVKDTIATLLAPVHELKAAVETLSTSTTAPAAPAPEIDVSALRQGVLDLLSDLPDRLSAATEALGGVRADLKNQQERLASKEDPAAKAVQHIETKISQILDEQQKLVDQNLEFSDFCQDIIKHVNSLPEAMLEATKVLQTAHSDIMERDTSSKDGDEIRRLMSANSELSTQLAKARGAHGQVRVEKDMLGERLRSAEAERDRMRTQVEQMQETVTTKSADAAAMEARNQELEAALAQALERIKSSDVTAQTHLERIANLEKTVQTLGDEKYQLKSKVDALELKATYAAREKETLAGDLAATRKQYEQATSQQDQWDELRRTTEQLQVLVNMVSQNDSEEVKELRRVRDKFRALESEHSTLQRRLKDQESKAQTNERTAQTARQSLSQAQQRAMEWEKRAKDYEHELESTRSRLDQAEQSQAQLDADYSLVKLQLEEKDAEERLQRDRESKLRDQVAALEEAMARLRAETDQAKKAAAAATAAASSASTTSSRPTVPSVPSRLRQNGYAPPARPDSRASTIFGDSRVTTPTPPANGTHAAPSIRPASPPQPSVWDSVHAPRNGRGVIRAPAPVTPKAKRPHQPYYPRIASPTPSNVSAAPTLGDDGWWA